eukprot:TRINITY_DN4783_c0_g1_i1.p1 TRINITY_DN4783_c0_g1~~TRINITY_DN4783_c0_g1_i1.p1  ORF type:complete len:1263 (-),score=289.16 TRINITY_DN4783_c0_g1_i1:41-3829(-)
MQASGSPFAAAAAPSAPPPAGGGSSSRSSGGRGRRQMADFSAMMNGGGSTTLTKSREPPMPTPAIQASVVEPPLPAPVSREPPMPVAVSTEPPKAVAREPPMPTPPVAREPPMPAPVSREPPIPIVNETPFVVASAYESPVAATPVPVPLQPPPTVGIDPPPARGSDAGGPPTRRSKKTAAERASQMYGTAAPLPTATLSVVPPVAATASSTLSVLPAVAPATLLPPSHPQPIPVSEPLALDAGASLFSDEAPPRPSWAGQVISPAPLTRTPEPAETPEPRHKVFDMFGGHDSSSSSSGADFFGKLSAAATIPDAAPQTKTPEPQLPTMSIGSPEMTNVSLTPTTTSSVSSFVAPAPHLSNKPPPPAAAAPDRKSVKPQPPFPDNFSISTGSKPSHEPPTTPSTPSKPVPSVSAPTPSSFTQRPTSAPSEATQALIHKAGELESTQRLLARVEREKEDLSRTHDVLLQRFRDLEGNYHKLQREQRDLRSKAEEAFLEIESNRETEKDLRSERDQLQAQILSLSQQLRQVSTSAGSNASSSSAAQQEIYALQRDNEQLRRAVDQLSKANEVLQSRVVAAGMSGGASGLTPSTTTTLATFEQAVAGVKHQYEERLRIMQKKIEALLMQQQKAELDMEDLKIQKRDAENRVAQIEKFANEDRQALQNKLVALQQRALAAEHRLASVVGANNASSTTSSAPDAGVMEEQRKALEKLAREYASMEQRCISLDTLLSQISRERDSVVVSLGEAQQKNSALIAERAQLSTQVEKLKLDLENRARATSSDATQEALRKALAERDSLNEHMKRQGPIMQNLMDENAKLISTVDFYKQVSKESRDVSVIEQLHRDKNVLLKTIADLSTEIEDLKKNKTAPKAESSVAAASIHATVKPAAVPLPSAAPSVPAVAAPPVVEPPTTLSVPVAAPKPAPSFSIEPDLFKPTDLKASSEFSLQPTTKKDDIPAAAVSTSTARPSALSMMSSVTGALATPSPSYQPSYSAVPVTLSRPAVAPPTTAASTAPMFGTAPVSAPAAAVVPPPTRTSAPPVTPVSMFASPVPSSAVTSASMQPPPPAAKQSIEPPPVPMGSNHVDDNNTAGSGKRRQRHIAFVNTASSQPAGAGMIAPPPFGAALPPMPASSVFVPTAPVSSGPLVEAGAPPPSITASSVAPPPKRNSPATAKRTAASVAGVGMPSGFGVPPSAMVESPGLVAEPDYDRVQTGFDEPPLMDVDTTGPSSPGGMNGYNGGQVETGTQGRGNFWGSVWKTVTLQ